MILDHRVEDPATQYDREAGLPTRRSTSQRLYVDVLKPTFDRVVAAVLLLALSPVMAVTALVLRLVLGPGVLLRQERVGLGGRTFTMVKFRTMQPCRRRQLIQVAVDRRVTHKTEADPRHTAVGRFLRKWSIDEIPELLNVLAGQMSLVGPRPELPVVVSRYADWQHQRHLAKPGLTGLWQVSQRGEGMMHDFTHVDIKYVRHMSPGLDLRILLRTPVALLSRRGS